MKLLHEFNISNQRIIACHPVRPELILFSQQSKHLILFDYMTQKVLKRADLSNNNYTPLSGCFLDEEVILNLPNNFLFINTTTESSELSKSPSNNSFKSFIKIKHYPNKNHNTSH
jgi:hypothetical protein